MNKDLRTLLAALLAFPCLQASAVWDMTPEQIGGDLYGSASVCKDIMPAAVEAGLKDAKLRLEGFGVDITAAAQSEGYKQAFSQEVNRLRSLSESERIKACAWNWGHWKNLDVPKIEGTGPGAMTQKTSASNSVSNK